MNTFRPIDEDDSEILLRTYYTTVIALKVLPPELIFHICQLVGFISPWPDPACSASTTHKPSKYQRTKFRTTEPRKIVSWFRTPPMSQGVLNGVQRIELRAHSHAPYPASRALASVYYNPLSGGTAQRRVSWRNFSLRLVSPSNPKQAKARWNGSPLSWPCFAHSDLPPDAEPQPGDPGVMLLDREHEVWEWAEVGDWLEVTVQAHFSWELGSFRLDGVIWMFKSWEPSIDMLKLIQLRTE